MSGRVYDAETKAEAVAEALLNGVTKAAATCHVDRHTLASWMAAASTPSSAAPGAAAVLATTETAAARFEQIVDRGTESILRRIDDPKARLSDVARATEVAFAATRLLTNASTANVALAGVGMNESLTLSGSPALDEELPNADWPTRLAIDRMTRHIWHALDVMPPDHRQRFAKAIDDVLASRDLDRFLRNVTDEAVDVDRHLVQRALHAISYITAETEELDDI